MGAIFAWPLAVLFAGACVFFSRRRRRRSLPDWALDLEEIIERLEIGVLVVEAPSGRPLLFNRVAQQILRVGREDLERFQDYGSHVRTFRLDGRPYPPEEWPLSRSLNRGETVLKDELEIYFKDGQRRFLELSSAPIRGPDHRIVGAGVSFLDVSEKKAVERNLSRTIERLRESEERFRILAAVSFGAIFVHEKGRIIEVNENAAEMYGYSMSELIGMNVLDLAAPESKETVKKHLPEKGDISYQGNSMRKDGSRFPSEVCGRELRYRGLRVRVSVVRDISAQKRVEELLEKERQARIEAQRALQARSDFLSIASHELRTPLTPLKLYIDVLKRRVSHLSGDLFPKIGSFRDALENSDREVRRLIRLTEDLLDVSRLGGGPLVLHRREGDLAAIVREEGRKLADDIKRSRCALVINAPRQVTGCWDCDRLAHVVDHLIQNALKFGAGRPIEVRVEQRGDRALLVLQDHGIGIAREDQGKIFDLFERAAPIQHYGGLGLGLYLAREIIRAHHGKISVESSPERGSVFTIELPRAA